VWTWGRNFTGALGNGNNSDSSVPVEALVPTGIVALSAGHEYGMALRDDGTVWDWGANSYGQLAMAANQDRNIPVPVIGLCAGPTPLQNRLPFPPCPSTPIPRKTHSHRLPNGVFDLTLLDLGRSYGHDASAINAQAIINISRPGRGPYALPRFTRDGLSLRSRIVKY